MFFAAHLTCDLGTYLRFQVNLLSGRSCQSAPPVSKKFDPSPPSFIPRPPPGSPHSPPEGWRVNTHLSSLSSLLGGSSEDDVKHVQERHCILHHADL